MDNNIHLSASIYYIAPQAQALMTIGMFNESLIPPVAFDCPTGNCTYASPYHSTGYCTKCYDRSDEVTTPSTGLRFWKAANITLSANLTTQTMDSVDSVMVISMNTTWRELPRIASINFMASQLTNCDNNSSTPWRCQGYGAATCEISSCVISYDGEVKIGSLNETIVNTSSVWSTPNDIWPQISASVDVSCLNANELESLKKSGADIGPNTDWLAYNISITQPSSGADIAIISETTIRPDCLYLTDRVGQSSLWSLFSDMFNDETLHMAEGPTGIIPDGPTQWQALWNQGEMDLINVRQTFDGLAKAMTYYARNTPLDSKEGIIGDSYLNGTTYQNTTCIQIEWQWITHLAVTIFGAIIFLFGTMIMTRPTLEINGQDYKTSILPLMFHGIEFTGSERSLKALRLRKEMAAEAKNTYVQFQATEKGWQFMEKKGV